MDYDAFLNEWRSVSDYVECHTSGSTGTPKTIMLPKSLMRESARRTIDFFGLDSRSHFHSCISADYIGGKMMCVRAEECGGSLSWEAPSNRPLRDYCGGKIDLLAIVPSQMAYILDRSGMLPPIKSIIIGGAPIPADMVLRIVDSGLDVWETYGMTETASHIALRRVGTPPEAFSPMRGITVGISERDTLSIDMGTHGRIVTNDLATVLPDGRFLIIGRADNVIITGGKKVHAEQVENVLENLLGREVLVSGEPDSKWGEKVVLTIDCLNDGEDISDDEIMNLCRNNLSSECVPKKIIRGRIPHTSNGKKARVK